MNDLSPMIGMVFQSVEILEDGEELLFTGVDGSIFRFYHDQDCCETVSIEDVTGDLEDLVGLPLLVACESTSENDPSVDFGSMGADSYTWTFYKFATEKGHVSVRWFGSSNGYYGEEVFLCRWVN